MQCHYQTHDNYTKYNFIQKKKYTKYKSCFPRSKPSNAPILYIELLHELDHPKSEKETKKYK